MKNYIKLIAESANIAFSMYSAIPMPKLDWTKENMKYALCFFPAVGIVEGAILLCWCWLCAKHDIGIILFAAVATAIPLAVSGGIHMDGFCDTVDALASHQEKERKLEILKDPHTGAFAVIGCAIYLIITFALWSETPKIGIDKREIIFAVSLISTRALSGLAVVSFPCAKTSGLAATFSNNAEKARTKIALIFWLIISALIVCNISLTTAIVFFTISAAIFFYYYRLSVKEFGGITGDLAGYFLQINQLVMLAVLTFV